LAITTRDKCRTHLDVHLLPQWQDWSVIRIFNGYIEIEKWVSELHEDLTESTVASVFVTRSPAGDPSLVHFPRGTAHPVHLDDRGRHP
jgi:hypothetical protein